MMSTRLAILDHSSRVELQSPRIDEDTMLRIRSKFKTNYFGLPPYSMQQTADGLTYQCRAPLESDLLEDGSQTGVSVQENERQGIGSRRNLDVDLDKIEANFAAQRKVSAALLTMVNNPLMMKHFLNKGGFEAVLKLVREAKDQEVLVNCSQCLIEVSSKEENCQFLVEHGIFQPIVSLQESHDETLRYMTSIILAKLSHAHQKEDLLLLNGMLTSIQFLFMRVHRTDSLCHLLLSLCNIAPAILTNEAELAIRFCFQAIKKIDVAHSIKSAIFVADLFNNFSRVSHYSSLLVDEGVLPLMLLLMDAHPIPQILRNTTETIANLSINRKNRREIASSGIATRLTLLFEKGCSSTRASSLVLMGNLLSSGLFHDKVANASTISNILDNLLDINFPRQFNAVSYCLSQLSKSEVSSDVLLRCGVVPVTLSFLRRSPMDSIDYLWTMLVNILEFEEFFPRVVVESSGLVNELFEEVRNQASAPHQQMCVVKIGYTLSRQRNFKEFLDSKLIDLFVKTMKILFSSPLAASPVRSSALINLIYFAYHCVESRAVMLSSDLIELFYDHGFEDDRMNVLFAALLNILSNEESCVYRLLESGAQKLLVSLQDSFQKLIDGPRDAKKPKKVLSRAMTSRSLLEGDGIDESLTKPSADANTCDDDLHTEGELGRELTAVILHNLALKRAVLSAGVLPMILNLMKNCKTLRVLHCARSLAHMSVHSKSKLVLSKDCRRLIPMLTVVMRCGCEEAEKVQHYCAIILCNVLSLSLEKSLLQDLVKTGAVVDLMVVTLLRINAISTKETLTKAFFNLLGRSEIREPLVLQLDILAALLELAKLEYVDLLELCMRTFYNITCELKAGSGVESNFATKLSSLRIPSMMVARLVFTPNMPGVVSNRPVRLLLGMAIANMSFNKTLVLELALSEGKLADAMGRVHALRAEETTYCTLVTFYNLSRFQECRVLANSKAVQLIVSILQDKDHSLSILCVQLAIATLCNFSFIPAFHDELSQHALKSMVDILSSPQIHLPIKGDAVQGVYNIIVMHQSSRSGFVQADLIGSLWKMVKVLGKGVGGDDGSTKEGSSNISHETDCDEEYLLILVGRVIKCICEDVSDVVLLRKMLADGIMNIILKLSKIEMNELKVDMSFSLYFLSRGAENLKVLKRDSVDIIFWLTLHDTLNFRDLIMRNVSRTLRAFSIGSEEAVVLVKHDRFFSVLKELIKSKNEDVLWQTAGMLYNIMHVDICLKKLLERGLIQNIFDLAASGFEMVKHVCSACLHMVPESMPNMEDPIALELVLCLLEAQGEKFSEITERPMDVLGYNLSSCNRESAFLHVWTNFVAAWNPYTCIVDNAFSPALIFSARPCSLKTLPVPSDPASIVSTEKHRKLYESDYNDFQRESEGISCGSISVQKTSNNNSSLHASTMSAPPPVEHEPPSHFPGHLTSHSSSLHSDVRKGLTNFPSKRGISDGSKKLSQSTSLPLISAPVPVPSNTLEIIRKTSFAPRHQEIFPSSISYKAAGKKV